MADLDLKKEKLAKWIKWGVGLLVAAVLAPVAVAALKGALSALGAVVVVWIIGAVVTQVLPALSFMLSNAILKLIKWEAKRNPVETLQNQLIEKQALLEQRNLAIVQLDGFVRSFKTKVSAHKKKYPNDAKEMEEQLGSFEAVLEMQQRNFAIAKQNTALFADEVERAQSKWEVTMAAQGVSKLTGKFANSVMDKIKQDTALESVEQQMNQAFAELDAAVDRGHELTSLPAAKQVVELPAPKERVAR